MKTYQASICLDCQAVLGEGPLWDAEDGTLLWVDILDSKLNRFNPETGVNSVIDVGVHVSTVVKSECGNLMVTCPDGFYTLNEETQELKAIHLPEEENDGIRFNDGKCDPAGRFWAGTIAYDVTPEAAKLYCLDTDGTVTEKIDKVTISNGICWNKDKMYYVDSTTKQVHAYDYDLSTGDISNKQIIFDVGEVGGFPDGMCLDEEGCLWVAFWGESIVRRISPQGEVLAQVHVDGASQVSACALGGKEGKTLFITTASTGVNLEKEPHAGKIFSCKVDVASAPVHSYSKI